MRTPRPQPTAKPICTKMLVYGGCAMLFSALGFLGSWMGEEGVLLLCVLLHRGLGAALAVFRFWFWDLAMVGQMVLQNVALRPKVVGQVQDGRWPSHPSTAFFCC